MKTPKPIKPYVTTEDFKMRLRVLTGRPAIVSNAYRPSKAVLRRTVKPNENTDQS